METECTVNELPIYSSMSLRESEETSWREGRNIENLTRQSCFMSPASTVWRPRDEATAPSLFPPTSAAEVDVFVVVVVVVVVGAAAAVAVWEEEGKGVGSFVGSSTSWPIST